MIHFVFAPGFGFTDAYWQNLLPLLPGTQSMLDAPLPPLTSSDVLVGVGHSLGLAHLICSKRPFNLLIGLQAFLNFCGTGEERHARIRQVDAMIRLFQKDASYALGQFYKACGYDGPFPRVIETSALVRDLQDLKEIYALPSCPTLIVAGDNDPIVPLHLLEAHFEGSHAQLIRISNTCHHALGFREASFVATLIESELRYLNLWSRT